MKVVFTMSAIGPFLISDISAPCRNGREGALGDISCSIRLSKILSQQFSKDPYFSRRVVPRWPDNVEPSFG
jgi:hypothetical protein